MSEKYNGWTNYETWLVNVWDFIGYDNECVTADYLEEAFTEYVEMTFPELANGASLITDLFNASVRAIDWHELAESHNANIED